MDFEIFDKNSGPQVGSPFYTFAQGGEPVIIFTSKEELIRNNFHLNYAPFRSLVARMV